MSESRAGGLDRQALWEFLEAELAKWDLGYQQENLHFLAVGLANALVVRGPVAESFEALRTALRPFAALLHKSMDSRVGGDDAPLWGIGGHAQFTVGDVRRAAAVVGTPERDLQK